MKRIERAEKNLADQIIACIVAGYISNGDKLGLLKSITSLSEAIKDEILSELKGIK